MSFNGHKNWNHWNVALWLFNDQAMHLQLVKSWKKNKTNKDECAVWLTFNLYQLGYFYTPDGAPITKTAIRAALRGL